MRACTANPHAGKEALVRLIVNWLITAVAVAFAIWVIPGIDVWGSNTFLSIGIVAVILAFLNAFLKPILQVISLPISVLTLGIFALIVNTAVLYLAAWLGNSLFNAAIFIGGFWSAFFASIVISIVTVILGAITGANKPNARSFNSRGR